MNLEHYHNLSAITWWLGAASTAVLLSLGAFDLFALSKDEKWSDKKWPKWTSVGILVVLGVVDCTQRHFENERSDLAESAFLGRSVQTEDRDAAIELLDRKRGQIIFECLGEATPEIWNYCEQIRKLFIDGHWDMSENHVGSYLSSGPPVSGVMLSGRSPGRDVAAHALELAGVPFSLRSPNGNVVVTVGQKPAF